MILSLHACFADDHPSEHALDIALLEFKPEYEASVLALQPPTIDEVVAAVDDVAVRDEQLCLLRLPEDLVRIHYDREELELRTLVHYAVLRRGRSGEKHPASGLHVDWAEATQRGQHPRGMSGGPLLRLRGMPGDATWNAADSSRIVGVASSLYPKQGTPCCERCESAADFGLWLREKAGELAARGG